MSRMKDLAIEIDEAGIDYNLIDLEDVEAFREAYQDKTGHSMSMIQAIKEIWHSIPQEEGMDYQATSANANVDA